MNVDDMPMLLEDFDEVEQCDLNSLLKSERDGANSGTGWDRLERKLAKDKIQPGNPEAALI